MKKLYLIIFIGFLVLNACKCDDELEIRDETVTEEEVDKTANSNDIKIEKVYY